MEYDEKGKYFTEVIPKIDILATIQTRTHLIEGRIHIALTERTKDALNEEERFLAVSDATVYSSNGDVLRKAEFMAVNREYIIWVIPHENEAAELERNDQDAG